MGREVSLNVLNYNTFEKTKTCIDSCLKQKNIQCQILLIDNQSTDGSYERLKELYGNNIEYLRNDDNYGFAKGNNIGVQYCAKHGYKYTFLLNSDTELIGDYLVAKLIEILENHNDCAVVAPTIYDVTRKGKFMHPNDSLYLKMLRLGGIIPSNHFVSDELEQISEAHGSALMVNNATFLRVGGFPEHYFMYGEEGTFAKKVLWSKKHILWSKDNNNYVLHHHDKTENVENWRLFLMGRNRGLEYWENRKGHMLWSFIYNVFFLKMLVIENGFRGDNPYLMGMKKSKELYRLGKSTEELFNLAKETKK